MADSVKVVNETDVQRIHSHKTSGRLHKGHNITAASASIPSQYQTIVTDNSECKGFSSRTKRFLNETGDANPGPGNYVGHSDIEPHKPSYSKKGTGGFASKDRRVAKHQTTYSPGPGVYALPGLISNQHDHNKAGSTSSFHKPIATSSNNLNQGPAPNEYNVTRANLGRTNNVAAEAAFKSKSKREAFSVGDTNDKPAPWQYHVTEELVKDSVKIPYSSFKSKTVRQMQQEPPKFPGPGTYHPFEPVEPAQKTIFPRKHYLCISAPAMPLPGTPPSPGPGSYEMVNYDGISKHYMSGAMFVSTTSRWGGDIRNRDIPGPAHYRPVGVGKQSFIYNAAGRWI